ncbi:hypothetical protein K440DRAFT_633492 [Wilcoxina mikolae CBS 423.85]|nr:hypothetical protein K440DRAFT_633492 [Wilcoxina mikolae CBS 423.85]
MKLEHAQKVRSTFMPRRVVVKPPTPPSQLAPKRKKKILALTLTPREKAIRSARIRARPPVMGHTNGFPLLKRPGRRIPQWVSVIINKKINKSVREVNALNDLKDNVFYYAQMEDAWDNELIRSGLLDKQEKDSVTWMDGAKECLIILRAHYRASELKTYQVTSRFQQIIDQANVQYRVGLRARRIKRRAWRKQQLINEMEGKLAGIQKEWTATKAQKVPPVGRMHSMPSE